MKINQSIPANTDFSALSFSPSVLLAEDDEGIAFATAHYLKTEGYKVDIAKDGQEVVDYLSKKKPDILLLDWLLPVMSGIDVCKKIRGDSELELLPVIIVSTKNYVSEKYEGLEAGADDYLVKPFHKSELIARIRAVMRRVRPSYKSRTLKFEDVEMNIDAYKVTRTQSTGKVVEVRLAPVEFKILQMFMEEPDRVFSREDIISAIWGKDVYVGSRTIDVHITRLRKSLISGNPEGREVIRTIRLGGYTINN